MRQCHNRFHFFPLPYHCSVWPVFVELNFDIWSACVNCTFAEEERACTSSTDPASSRPPSLSAISLKQTHRDMLILCLPIQIPLTAVSLQNMSVTKCKVSLACTWGSRGKTAVWPVRKPQPELLQFCQTPSVEGSPQATAMTHRHTALSQTQ